MTYLGHITILYLYISYLINYYSYRLQVISLIAFTLEKRKLSLNFEKV